MSYDVSAGQNWFNYTSNMSHFLRDFGVYPPDWNGKPRAEVAERIESALESIKANRLETLKAEYDADNGWGDVESAIRFLENVREACRWQPPDLVEVSW